jgi:hypothetical protein
LYRADVLVGIGDYSTSSPRDRNQSVSLFVPLDADETSALQGAWKASTKLHAGEDVGIFNARRARVASTMRAVPIDQQ